MTVKDFIDLCYCDSLDIVIRENGDSKWIYGYRVGPTVEIGKYDFINGRSSNGFYVPSEPVEVSTVLGDCKKLVFPFEFSKLPK